MLEATKHSFENTFVPDIIIGEIDKIEENFIAGLANSKMKIEDSVRGNELKNKELLTFKTNRKKQEMMDSLWLTKQQGIINV